MLSSDAAISNGQALKVLFANAQAVSDNPRQVIAEIERLDPDVIVLAEATPTLDAAIGNLSATYPYKISEPRQHPFGMILLSKWPFDGAGTDIVMLPRPTEWETEPPVAIVARIETSAGLVTVIGVHPFPPLMGQAYAVRNYQLDVMADVIAQQPPPVIAVGDFNATPWSPTLRRFMNDAGLQGPNILTTWPVALGLAGLPLDHILLSRDLAFRRIERGGDIGSDHRPVFAVVMIGGAQGSPGTP
jgi:endonuclease/exonuclease/phosphatase (EEP) superfamily protein YafD